MKNTKPSPAEQVEWLKGRSTHLIEPKELEARIAKGPLAVKFGVDPTTAHLHLGHMVPVWVLRKLQEWDHRITIVIGDFTAYIGDPSGRQSERPALSMMQINENKLSYRNQVGKILNLQKTVFKDNSSWLNGLSIFDLFTSAKIIPLSAVTQREDFRNREKVSLAEGLYSTLVGIDSVELKTDLEIGGQDQLLNLTASRDFMRARNLKPESILTTPILRGTSNDGRKMSKSYGNAINVLDNPNEMFGKVMSIPDAYLTDYFTLATELPESQWRGLVASTPREAKLLLAKTIVATYHSLDAAADAGKVWVETFSERQVPEEVPTYTPKHELKDFAALLVDAGMAKSRTDAVRLLKDGAVEQLEGPGAPQVLNEKSPLPKAESVYKIGKRRFLKIVIQ